MAIATAIKKIENARKKYDAALAALTRKKLAKALGAAIPKGFALVWDQYTPGFNDGDPCTFSRNGVRLVSVKTVEALEAIHEPDPDEPEGTETENTDDGSDLTHEAMSAAMAEEIGDDEGSEPDADPSDDVRDFSDTTEHDEDRACGELMHLKVADLKWCGGPDGKKLAALKKAWAMVDDDAIIGAAFGEGDGRFVIHAGGKIEEHEYDCGY